MNLPRLLLQKLRIANPWRYKVPFLVAVPYAVIALLHIPPGEAAVALGMSFCTIFGIAGFGYLTNDYADRAEDAKAGKQNVLIGMRPVYILLLLLLLLGMAIVPWVVYFPVDRVALILLGAEFLLFVLYAMPPFRLKERGMLGVVADALYAHALPAILAGYTFWLIGDGAATFAKTEGLKAVALVLGAWQSFVGLRNILLHQIGDFDKDRATGTRTFAVRAGKAWTRNMLLWVLGCEVVGLALLTLGMQVLWGPAMGFVLYAGYFLVVLWFRVVVWKVGFPRDVKGITTVLLDEYYCHWIPVCILVLLAVRDPWFWAFLAVHCLLFPNAVVTWFRHSWDWLKWKIR